MFFFLFDTFFLSRRQEEKNWDRCAARNSSRKTLNLTQIKFKHNNNLFKMYQQYNNTLKYFKLYLYLLPMWKRWKMHEKWNEKRLFFSFFTYLNHHPLHLINHLSFWADCSAFGWLLLGKRSEIGTGNSQIEQRFFSINTAASRPKKVS